MKRIAIFASGEGSNFQVLADACRQGEIPAEAALMVCDRPTARVNERADRMGIERFTFSPRDYASKAEYEREIVRRLDEKGIDLVCLAGYMRILSDELLGAYGGRIVNIHPSLLPKYGGKGMYGRHIHESVVAAGEKETGITIHFVSDACDEGRIIFQASVPVEPTDTPAEVECKIHALEREHFPRVIAETILGTHSQNAQNC